MTENSNPQRNPDPAVDPDHPDAVRELSSEQGPLQTPLRLPEPEPEQAALPGMPEPEPEQAALPGFSGPESVTPEPPAPQPVPQPPAPGPVPQPPAPQPVPQPPAPGPHRHYPGKPGGRPTPVPAAPKPAAPAPTVEPVDPHQWGRIDAGGSVYVRTATGERKIGEWQAGDTEAGLAHYGQRYDELVTEIALLESRLGTHSGDPKSIKHQAEQLRDSLDKAQVIGDLDTAAARLEVVIAAADNAVAGAAQARAVARTRAVAAKETLCAEAEQLAESTQWKTTGDRLRAIVEEWRTIRGIDRKTDDALWKRFAKARDAFTRRRGAHFAELDKQRGAAKDAKEALIARAEALSESTDWGETAAAYRTLMTEWKAAGRAPREAEDALWERFRAAQEAFFSRRNKTFSERDAEFDANAAAKETLLAEAAAIDPAADLDDARRQLRDIQRRWEAIGKVPRERIRELDSRLRAAEDKVAAAEKAHWRRTDPAAAARLEQFRARVESFEAQAAKARAAGDERRAAEAEASAAQWQQYLAAAEGAVDR